MNPICLVFGHLFSVDNVCRYTGTDQVEGYICARCGKHVSLN